MSSEKLGQCHTKKTFTFTVLQKQVTFTSDFDTGNLNAVKQISYNSYIVTPSFDSYKTEVTIKTFFHFRVEGYEQEEISIRIQPMGVLTALQKSGNLETYRPWIRYGEEAYKRMEQTDVRVYGEDTLCLAIRFSPKQSTFYLSFSEPYSYQRYLDLVYGIKQTPHIYYHKQILCYSLQNRPVYLLNITSADSLPSQDFDKKQNNLIFPEQIQEKMKMCVKATVIMTARVHPGEASSSLAMEGMIQFLLSNDLRAHILRKLFNFIIIPMLNPDGVYNGFYRTDTLGNNLNRFYSSADQKQPSILCTKAIIQFYANMQKLLFYFDLHGHPSFKGGFLYGNYMEELSLQSEAFLFAKLISANCSTFSLSSCNFAKTQMTAKDRPSQPSKQGSGRVFTYKTANIPHSFTIQFGMHSTQEISEINDPVNVNFVSSNFSHIYNPPIYKKQKVDIEKQILIGEGISVLISILDLLDLNPYSRINKGAIAASQLRKSTLKDTYQKIDRFRLVEKLSVPKILASCKNIQDNFAKHVNTKWMYNFYWPDCVRIKRSSRVSSCVGNLITYRPSEPTIEIETIKTEEYRVIDVEEVKKSETARNSKDPLMLSFQRIRDSNTMSAESSKSKTIYKQQFRQRMQAWTGDMNMEQEGQSPPSKTKLRYKRLFILDKDMPERKEYARMVEINFDQLRLQPQSQTIPKLPQTSTKLIKRESIKQQERIRYRIPSRSQSKPTPDLLTYNLLLQKQRQPARKNSDFKLASLLQPIQRPLQRFSQPYSDQKMRISVRKDVKLEKFIKSFKEKRRSKV